MEALYAFLRVTDDLADDPGELRTQRAILANWRTRLARALEGEFSHPVHAALADTVTRYQIPPQFLYDVIDGVESDLHPVRFATFAELDRYCDQVATAVGLACTRIWGLRSGATFDEADPPARSAGRAFQLTNILRDLGEDLCRGRVYIPTAELTRWDCPPELWRQPQSAHQVRALVDALVERARVYYRESETLASLLSDEGRGIFRVMCGTYRRLLEEVGRAGETVVQRRVGVPRWRKGLILLSGWASRRGWL